MTRGRDAETPVQIPATGWLDIAWRIKNRLASNRVSLVAAGVAFYALLALFPALGAVLAIGGLVVDPQTIIEQIVNFNGVVPEDVLLIIKDQATDVTTTDSTGLGLTALIGLLLSFWSASRGMANLVMGLNLVYSEEETRGFIRLNLRVLFLTALLIIGFLISIASIIAVPAILSFAEWPVIAEWLASVSRWAVMVIVTLAGLAMIYRLGPSRSSAEWQWVTPGAMIACAMWILASVGFTYYVGNFASYNESFGALGGVVIMIMWLWISAFVVLLGGEINAETEAQTKIDTTTGPSQPMGERGAVKADTLGKALSESNS